MARLALALWMTTVGLALPAWAEEEEPAPDSSAALLDQLLAADRAWSETPPDPEKFAAYFAAGGRLFPPGAPLAEGHEAILETTRALFGAPGFALEWRATGADVAASGDLGFTFGTFVLRGQDEAGAATEALGKYLTVWRRGDDRTWRVVADIFNGDGTPPEAGS